MQTANAETRAGARGSSRTPMDGACPHPSSGMGEAFTGTRRDGASGEGAEGAGGHVPK